MCSLADLALNVTYDASRKTAFLKVRTRIDLRRTKDYRQYLHWSPEHVQRMLLVNSSSTSAVPDLDLSAGEEQPEQQPNTNTQLLNPGLRYLHFETRRAATLIVPRYPCEAKSVDWARKFQLFQSLGQAPSFTLAVSIPLRTIPDAVLRALAKAFARQDLAADAEEARYQRYYRGRAIAVDLAVPNLAGIPSVAELAGYRHQDDKAPDLNVQPKTVPAPSYGVSGTQPPSYQVPPSYNQSVDESSSPDPLRGSPPTKKRRRTSPGPSATSGKAEGLLPMLQRLEQSVGRLQDANWRIRAEYQELRKENRVARQENAGLRTENQRLHVAQRRAHADNQELRAAVAALETRVGALAGRLDAESAARGENQEDVEARLDQVDERLDGIDEELITMEAWRDDHDMDRDELDREEMREVAREVLDDETEGLCENVLDTIVQRLGCG